MLPSCFSSPTTNKCPLCGLFSVTFLIILCFLLVIWCLKGPLSIRFKCLKVQADCDGLAHGEDMLLGNLSPSITGSTVGFNSMLIKQQYTLNEMFLNRNTY